MWTVNRVWVVTVVFGLVIAVGSGCDASADRVRAPFAAERGTSSGPGSGLWGDGSSGPKGMQIGCIDGRRFAVLITVRNRTKRTITLLAGGGRQRSPGVITRVAVQVRLAPPPSEGLLQPGLRAWIGQNSPPVAVPGGRSAWVQSNFLMRNCRSLPLSEALTLNRSVMLTYEADGTRSTQVVSVPAARIILTRGPLHPKLPINQVG
jgi:hypothetical protein